jgi:hypothetical protein
MKSRTHKRPNQALQRTAAGRKCGYLETSSFGGSEGDDFSKRGRGAMSPIEDVNGCNDVEKWRLFALNVF